MGNGVMPNGLSDRAHPRLYLKRPAVAPTEGLLTEALLKHEGAVRTDAIDPKRKFDPRLELDSNAYPQHWLRVKSETESGKLM
jgi:hypothetical protein